MEPGIKTKIIGNCSNKSDYYLQKSARSAGNKKSNQEPGIKTIENRE